MVRRLRVVVVVLLAVVPLWVRAQQPFIKDLSLTENNVNVKVNGLAQDEKGFIWIATDIGLFRFNGRNFLKIADSLQKPVTAVAATGEQVWIGLSNGRIGKVESRSVRYKPVAGGPVSAITSLYFDGLSLLMAGTEEQGLFVYVNNTIRSLNTSKGLSDNFIYGFSVIDRNEILAGSDIGINDISLAGRAAVQTFSTRQGLPDNIVSVVRRIQHTALYWIGTQEGGITIFDRTRKTFSGLPGGGVWKYGQVNDIIPVSATRAWAATESGYLLELTTAGGQIKHVAPYYYPGRNFRRLLLDRAGNIWCGTSKGFSMVTAEYAARIKLEEPYSLQGVTAMTFDNDNLLIALRKDLYQLDMNDTARHLRKIFGAKANITSMYTDKDSCLWIGTFGDGLYYRRKGAAITKLVSVQEVGKDANILNVTGARNSIWVAGLNGVEELAGAGGRVTLVKHHGKKTGIGSDYVYQLYSDRKGNVWMATDGAGVCMYDGTNYHHWNAAFGQNSKVAYSIAEDAKGDIWAATMYKDLFHYSGNNKWDNLRLPETQYPDVNISTVAANATGQVVSVYQRCMDVWYPESRYFRHFNRALGVGIDSTSNVLNCVAKDREGNVYLPYQQGIIIFKNQTEKYDIRPGVQISHPTVFSKPLNVNKYQFAYDENYIGFGFDGIGFANHERLNFRYMLEGYNEDWIYTNDASVTFPKLSPGHYRFRVQASLNPAFEHPNEDDYAFVIAAPFWKNNWFYAGAALILFALGYLYVKLREKRLKSMSRLQQERMKFEYEHLKSQVNPHFLFNSLYALSILIEEKKENALSYTVNLADLYRNMLAHSGNDLIPLKEEFDILNNYINIQQTRFGAALRVQTTVPAEVMEKKKIVPLAIQLLVENAIKHNVVSMSQPLEVTISATWDEITVRNRLQPKMSREHGAGIGLANIRRRYSLLTNRPISYGIKENEFVVTLPLL